MFEIIFTSDYEIHGNGEGCPKNLMVDTTYRMMDLFDSYGAKLTIMADVAEIFKFQEYYKQTGIDKFYYNDIINQLQKTVNTRHDVQLHIHSSYFGSQYDENGSWKQNYFEYDLANLNYDRLYEIIKDCKSFLEKTLKPFNDNYCCIAFRAANWSMQPSGNITKALINNGIKIDTSVFKYGRRQGLINFNYMNANDELLPWSASNEDICIPDNNSRLLEIPIYCEKRSILPFLTLNRLSRVVHDIKHPLSANNIDTNDFNKIQKFLQKVPMLFKRHAWKMDFNQCSGRQLIAGLKRIEKKYDNIERSIPIVLIGHSKLFNKMNEKSLKPFLKYVRKENLLYRFSTFRELSFL
jgi:hypothetical protein